MNMQDLGILLRIEAQVPKVTDDWKLALCAQPSSMDMDRANQRIFSACRSGVMAVVNRATGTVVDMQPIGKGVDATELTPARGWCIFPAARARLHVGLSRGHIRQVHAGRNSEDATPKCA